MRELIDREAALDAIKFAELGQEYDEVEKVPSVDAVLVRHGYNVKDDSPSLFECSICGWEDYDTYTGDTDTYNYCPNCGARMDGERRES